jgi:nucleoside-diphosphate-sugar epimerase
MKLCVTGALGHIGSKLIHSLPPGRFDEVVLVDNLLTQRYCSLFDLPRGVRFRWVEADICSADLPRLFDGIDVVVHLAAITDAASSFDKPEQVELVNQQGTEKVAAACVATGSKLFFPSTTSVYGVQDAQVDEDCPPADLKPQSPYALSKRASEEHLLALGREGKLKSSICRLGTIFGTSIGMRFHTAVNKFCWQASFGQPLTVWRTALHQRRPYLDLGDCVRALDFIIETDRFDSRICNVVTENATVADIVDAIRARIGDVEIKYVDSPIMNQLSYDVSAARFRGLGFEFRGNFARGIADTLDLLRSAAGRSV